MKKNIKIKGLEQVNLNAAGIDIGSEVNYVAVPHDRDTQPVKQFGCFTPDILQLCSWLKKCKIDTVAMESTGVYWIPVFQILEKNGFEVLLVNARHIKNVPGRKTDVKDCQWIQQLHTFGLLTGSFHPDEDIRPLRTLLRHRDNLVKARTPHIQRMQKALIQMNIQLHKVIADITGLTGMKIIKSIIEGEQNPLTLAEKKDPRIKSSEERIAKALTGDYRKEHLFCLKQEFYSYNFMCDIILECENQIELYLKKLEGKKDNLHVEDQEQKTKKKDLPKKQLERICGADLTQVDGFDITTIQTILSEVGTNMNKWSTEKHFGSWLGLSPNNKITGGKIISSKTTKVVSFAATAFRLAAVSAGRSNSAIGAFYRRLRSRIGGPKAITATAYKLARIYYRCVKYARNYKDIGASYYEEKYKERLIKNLKKRAIGLGLQVVPVSGL